jgi:predicted small secreted protein
MDVRKYLAACGLAAVTGLGLSAPALAQADAADYEKMLRAAEAAQKTAADVGGEWRDVGKLIKGAKAAAESGAYAKATALANKARQQSELGYKQALAEKSAGMPAYVK